MESLPVECQDIRGEERQLQPAAAEDEIETVAIFPGPYPESVRGRIGKFLNESITLDDPERREEYLVAWRIRREKRI